MSLQVSKHSTGSLTKYDPDRGLKTVAAAEAAVKHYARAKDASKLQQAIRAKLEAQAEFVLWWDNHVEKDKGGRPAKTSNRSVRGLRLGENGLPEPMVVSRWRLKLNDPDKFEQTYEQACAKFAKILECEKTAHVEQNSGENEWYTPTEFVEAARAVMGDIDLDPATSESANSVIKAAQIFTTDDDGLDHQWDGRVWMNPPYAQPLISKFCEKLARDVEDGRVVEACVLVNNATETQWFRTLADVGSAICFPTGRVRFWSPANQSASPLQGQALIYVGPSVDQFHAQFASFGFVVDIRKREQEPTK